MASVNKVQVDGVVYDLGGSGGFSDNAKNALLDCLSHIAWVDENGQQYVDALQTALFADTWSVTNSLTNAVTSNPSATVVKDGGYSATISASVGYTLTGATVSVTMNGADITATAYNNGAISIPSVTGDLVITVVAVALTVVSISAVYTQSGTVYNTDSLDSLKADLVVTATFNDDSTVIVPSADYTLTGTLTGGTSTITVEYDAVTTTFNVTVSLGFLYTPDNGLLSAQPYATLTLGTGCTEVISDGILMLNIPKAAVDISYAFSPSICISGTMKARVKVIDCGNQQGPQYYRHLIGNGSAGASAGFYELNTDETKIRVGYSVGSSGTPTTQSFDKSEWHDIEVIFDGSKQSVKVDGITVVSSENPATNAALVNNKMQVRGSANNLTEVHLERLEFNYVA